MNKYAQIYIGTISKLASEGGEKIVKYPKDLDISQALKDKGIGQRGVSSGQDEIEDNLARYRMARLAIGDQAGGAGYGDYGAVPQYIQKSMGEKDKNNEAFVDHANKNINAQMLSALVAGAKTRLGFDPSSNVDNGRFDVAYMPGMEVIQELRNRGIKLDKNTIVEGGKFPAPYNFGDVQRDENGNPVNNTEEMNRFYLASQKAWDIGEPIREKFRKAGVDIYKEENFPIVLDEFNKGYNDHHGNTLAGLYNRLNEVKKSTRETRKTDEADIRNSLTMEDPRYVLRPGKMKDMPKKEPTASDRAAAAGARENAVRSNLPIPKSPMESLSDSDLKDYTSRMALANYGKFLPLISDSYSSGFNRHLGIAQKRRAAEEGQKNK